MIFGTHYIARENPLSIHVLPTWQSDHVLFLVAGHLPESQHQCVPTMHHSTNVKLAGVTEYFAARIICRGSEIAILGYYVALK